jgi:RNA polymerase sigma factor (sigma-70 family)
MAESLPPELSQLFATSDIVASEAAWTDFVSVYSPLLLHAARSAAGSYDEVMDSYAYVLEGLHEDGFRRLRGYKADPRSKFSTWLVLVARRMCIDRKRERYGRGPAAHQAESSDADERATRRRLVDLTAAEVDLGTLEDFSHDNPERQLLARELSDVLDAAIADLPPRDQLLLTLRFADELSAREIAAIQAWPSPVDVYRRLAQVMKLLRGNLSQRGVDNSIP